MSNWIGRHLEEYQQRYNKCKEKERALSYCSFSMIKLLSGIYEMNHAQFHIYERKVLGKAMKLFSKQCIEQIDEAMLCKSVVKKKRIIDDIEQSISIIYDVYRGMIDGTGGLDRQTIQSIAVNTGTCEFSPKLCNFFSDILESICNIFKEDELEYAFLIYTRMQNVIETKVLLEERKYSGKVVVIFLPENVVERFDLVSVCLLHEVFHVLSKKERMRKQRASYLIQCYLHLIYTLLFKDIDFGVDKKISVKIKNELFQKWLDNIQMEFKELMSTHDEKIFYSKRIVKQIYQIVGRCLLNVDLTTSIEGVMRKFWTAESYDEYTQRQAVVEKVIVKLQENLLNLIISDLKVNELHLLMKIYREVYADMACILTLQLTPQAYFNAFEQSISFANYNKKYVDMERQFRIRIVAKVVIEYLPEELSYKWKIYCSKKNIVVYNNINQYKNMERNIIQYLSECAKLFVERCSELEGLNLFREKIQKVMCTNNFEYLTNILADEVGM